MAAVDDPLQINAKAKAVGQIVKEVGVPSALEGFFADKITLSEKEIEKFKNDTAEYSEALGNLTAKAVYSAKHGTNISWTTAATATTTNVQQDTVYMTSDVHIPKPVEDVLTKEDVKKFFEAVAEDAIKPLAKPIITAKQKKAVAGMPVYFSPLDELGGQQDVVAEVEKAKKKITAELKKTKTKKAIMVSVPVDFVPMARSKKKLEFHIMQPGTESDPHFLCGSIWQTKNWDVLSPTDCVTAMLHFSSYVCKQCAELNSPGK